jgi:hypothetical protein
MLSKLGRVWFFSTIARLTQLSWPREAKIRQWPYIVRTGDGCEVRCYKGEVSITLVLVLDVIPLAIIYVVICAYSR